MVNALAVSCLVVLLGLLDHTWLDDDPCTVLFVSAVDHPWHFFVDKIQIIDGANALTPFQFVSLWADYRVFGADPSGFYAHQIVSFCACATAFWFLARQLASDRFVALLVTICWMWSAATLSVASFISVRHYIDGLTLSLVALGLVAGMRQDRRGRREWVRYALAIALAAAAFLHKEVFVVLLAPPLLLLGFRRSWKLGLVPVVLCAAYGVYRIWALGPRVTYLMPLLPLDQAWTGLRQLPRALGLGPLGDWLALAACALPLVLAVRRRFLGAAIAAVALGGQVAVVYPVAYALKTGVLSGPGTWSRVAFVFLTLVLLACLRLVEELRVPAVVRHGAFLLLAAVLGFQAGLTAHAWEKFNRQHAAELEFLLRPKDPSGVIVSTVPASWYLVCAADLYQQPSDRYTFPDGVGRLCERRTPAWIWNGQSLQPFEPACGASGSSSPR